jgi:hypothetical protein
MPIKVIVTRNFDHMSEAAAGIVGDEIRKTLHEKKECVLGLTAGNSPTGMYKHLARMANGERKTRSVAESLLGDPDCTVPISCGQTYAKRGGSLIYVIDRIAAQTLLENRNLLRRKGIVIDMRA